MTVQSRHSVPNREYKSRIFVRIFEDKQKLLELYNAVSGKHYSDPELLTINTLENAIYMSMYNDLSFLIDSRLSLYEHQSTQNPNMPVRFLLYLSDLYASMVKGKNLYGTRMIPLPTPRCIVFYNGHAEQPDREILYLSDAYTVKDGDYSLELKAEVLNINAGHNRELLETCRTLGEYAEYVRRVREYTGEMPIEDAVERAIRECIAEDILKEFLEQNRAEAKAMSIYEYNEEEHIRMEREDAFEDGRKAGYESGVEEGRKQERMNTEKEKRRAEQERERAEMAEAEIQRLKTELEILRIRND